VMAKAYLSDAQARIKRFAWSLSIARKALDGVTPEVRELIRAGFAENAAKAIGLSARKHPGVVLGRANPTISFWIRVPGKTRDQEIVVPISSSRETDEHALVEALVVATGGGTWSELIKNNGKSCAAEAPLWPMERELK
jgi:hypothetical protein